MGVYAGKHGVLQTTYSSFLWQVPNRLQGLQLWFPQEGSILKPGLLVIDPEPGEA